LDLLAQTQRDGDLPRVDTCQRFIVQAIEPGIRGAWQNISNWVNHQLLNVTLEGEVFAAINFTHSNRFARRS
jgi:hypothetical protein